MKNKSVKSSGRTNWEAVFKHCWNNSEFMAENLILHEEVEFVIK